MEITCEIKDKCHIRFYQITIKRPKNLLGTSDIMSDIFSDIYCRTSCILLSNYFNNFLKRNKYVDSDMMSGCPTYHIH